MSVLWKSLGELGTFENIGVDKKIVEGEQYVTLLNFVDVFNHKHIDSSIPQMKVTANERKIKACDVKKGDIFVTPSSETPDDIGHSAIITEDLHNTVYSYHIMRFRMTNLNMTTAYYINYIFDTDIVKAQILKKAKGLTRFGLSRDAFTSIQIPFPSAEIQTKLVKKIDSFLYLISKLDEEIELRKQQLDFYCDKLLYKGDSINILDEYVKLGKDRIPTSNVNGSNYVSVENLLKNKAGRKDTSLLPSGGNCIGYKKGDVLLGNIRPYLRKIWFADREGGTNGDVVVARVKDEKQLRSKYLFYLLSSEKFFEYYTNFMKDGKMPRGDKNKFLEFPFGYKKTDEQDDIVEKLDAFTSLIVKLQEERDLRQKQYEYYREKLLTFE